MKLICAWICYSHRNNRALVIPVLYYSKVQVLSSDFSNGHLAPKHTYNPKGFPADSCQIIKRDGAHWLQMKPISSHLIEVEVQQISAFVILVFRTELPSWCLPYDQVLFNALQLVSSELWCDA